MAILFHRLHPEDVRPFSARHLLEAAACVVERVPRDVAIGRQMERAMSKATGSRLGPLDQCAAMSFALPAV